MSTPWLRRVIALASSRSRIRVVMLTVIRVVSRVLIVATASIVASGSAALATGLGLLAAASMVVQRILEANTRSSVEGDLYRATASAFLSSDAIDVDDANPERTFLTGIHEAGRIFYETAPGLIGDGVVLVFLVPYVFYVSAPRLIAIVVLAAAGMAVSSFAVRGRTRRVESELNDAFRAVLEQLFAAIDGRLEIIASGRDRSFLLAFDQTQTRYQRLSRRLRAVSALLGRIPLAAAMALVLGVVALDAQSRDVLTRALLGEALVLAACLPSVFSIVLGTYVLTRARLQLAPFLALFDRPERAEVGRERVVLPAPFLGEDLSFAYSNGGPLVFEGVSVRWDAGILVALGPNGSGKSTLLKLLLGLRAPTRGRLTSGGVELADIDLPFWRARIAYLPQRPYLGEPYITVRGAFRLAAADASDEQMLAALDELGLRAMLHRRPDPLSLRIGELSAGQRQRLAIARIVVQDAKLVLLDEPDANLDAEGIALVARFVARLKDGGKMVAVAAHTRELVAIADVVVNLGATK